uniref:Pyridoxal-5'-phosphate-dependent protein beta subunit n=1 Tax=Phaselicystis flava TaxID=525924 RepID=A0A3S5GYG9_9BACT|nr:pyridoxal-5'-phosphate-dependent protein beta subunit [Phaselicystis flava]
MQLQSELSRQISVIQSAMRETPITEIAEPDMNLFVKLEHCNMIGSSKDRSALWMLKSAVERGELDAETTIIESSSGNVALALASFCRLLGLPFVPVIDPNISSFNESALRAACEVVVKVEERDDTGGYLKTRLAKVKELCNSSRRAYWTNQYSNRDNMLGHFHLTAGEICRSFSQLDFVFVAVSTAGTIAGISRRLKERFPGVKVIAVDAEGSVAFGGKPKKRYLPGVGSSITPDLLSLALIDDVVIVPEIVTAEACRELFYKHGLFLGASSGTVYAAIKRYAPRMRGPRKPNVLFLSPDRGTAYVSTVYNDAWVSQYLAVS